MTKKTKPAKTKASAEEVLDDALEVLKIGLQSIRDEIDKIQDGTAKESKYDDASRIAHLAKQAGSIADSVRKTENARAKRLDAITKPVVVAWFRALSEDDRTAFLRELQQINSKRSVLG